LCPHAHVKLFLTASAEVRAIRRLQELVSRGMVMDGDKEAREAMYEKVLEV
jgi:cytidylate kinase